MELAGVSTTLPSWCTPDFVERLATESGRDLLTVAVRLAALNVERATGGPFGSIVARPSDGRVLGVGINLVEISNNPLLHAECVAIAMACRALQTHSLRMEGAASLTLYSSSEPCLMCLGAIHWCGLQHVVYAAPADVAEGAGFDEGPARSECLREMKAAGVRFERHGATEPVEEIMRTYVRRSGTIYNG
jgi:tRNA(Arg) A34 adenosine deaminase TadA